MINSIQDYTTLQNGVKMPWLGFGVWQMFDAGEVEKSINRALEVGYRSIDTAKIYRNEDVVGKTIRSCGIPRESIFVTTKVWNDDLREGRTTVAFNESMDRLGLDYVDLYLIHWPVEGCYLDAWKELEEIYRGGRAKAIGVSNFLIHHLEDLLAHNEVKPMVNQVEFHPWLVQPELLEFCKRNNIQSEAWAPLIQGKIMEIDLIAELAKKYGKSPAQIALRWNLQHRVVTIPKSANPKRIAENADIFNFELSAEDMVAIDSLDQGKRIGPDPDNFNL